MNKIEKATKWMIDLATDKKHGYDQINRWGPDYDCSSAIITAWKNAGVPVKSQGATYTGNMRPVFLSCGFSDVTKSIKLSNGYGLKYGDVLLNILSHTAMYIGNGEIVHASINENGQITGGNQGDQSGKEICIRSYYNKPWDCVLRYSEDRCNGALKNELVCHGQSHANNFAGTKISTDGIRGVATKTAGIKVLQTAMNLDYNSGIVVDGIWGCASDKALKHHYIRRGTIQYMVTATEILLLLKGYNPDGVEMPGIYGSGLEKAVKEFKKDKNLTINDNCDKEFFLKLIH